MELDIPSLSDFLLDKYTITHKTCSKCFTEKVVDDFHPGRKVCIPCYKKLCKEYKERGREKTNIAARNWYKKNKEKCLASAKKYKKSEKGMEAIKKYRETPTYKKNRLACSRRSVNVVSDRYVKSLLVRDTEIRGSEIPKPLIALKKQHILLRRLANEKCK